MKYDNIITIYFLFLSTLFCHLVVASAVSSTGELLCRKQPRQQSRHWLISETLISVSQSKAVVCSLGSNKHQLFAGSVSGVRRRSRHTHDSWILLLLNFLKFLDHLLTYLCGQFFSRMLGIKMRKRTRLCCESDMRMALTNLQPRISELVSQRQQQKSH